MEKEFQDYITLCRLVGGWTDWVQGGGGNISVKHGGKLLIKRSGALLGDTTKHQGWVLCEQDAVEKAMKAGQEDISHTVFVVPGMGKPSIETFLHCLPGRIVVHLHPAFMLGMLCSSEPPANAPENWTWIPYAKPGIPLAKLLFSAYVPNKSIYLLQNHGILFVGETIDAIQNQMEMVYDRFCQIRIPSLPFTNVRWAFNQFCRLREKFGEDFLVQPIGRGILEPIQAFTPDIAVFLTSSPPSLLCDGEQVYAVGKSLQACTVIKEMYLSHQYAVLSGAKQVLTAEEVDELLNWDKEKERVKAF